MLRFDNELVIDSIFTKQDFSIRLFEACKSHLTIINLVALLCSKAENF